MATEFIESCGAALFDTRPSAISGNFAGTFWDVLSGTGTWTVESTIVPSQAIRSLKFTNATPAAGAIVASPLDVCAAAGGRVSIYQRMEVLATGSPGGFILSVQPDWDIKLYATLAGELLIRSGTTNIVTSASSFVAAEEWHRYSMSWTITDSTTYTIRVFLDGAEVLTVTNGSALTTSALNGILQVGVNTAYGDANSVWVAHVYADDLTSLTDTGDIKVTAKRPAAVNNNQFGTTIGTGAVDERPISETNGKSEEGASIVSQDYTLETASEGDVDITNSIIVSYCGWVWTKAGAGTAGSPQLKFNGINSAITLSTTSAVYQSPLIDSNIYPSDAAGIGMVSSGADADTLFYEAGSVVAFAPLVESVDDILNPIRDLVLNSWTTNTGKVSNLWNAIDESAASDTDYIQSPQGPTTIQYYQAALETKSDPFSSAGHIAHYRYQKNISGGAVNLTIALLQGDIDGINQLAGTSSDFEVDIGDWVPINLSTIVETTAQAHGGSKSLEITGTGSGTAEIGIPEIGFIDITGAVAIDLSTWVRTAATARSVRIGIDFFEPSDVPVGSRVYISGADSTSWTQLSGTITVPETATKVRIAYEILSSINTEIHYIDDVSLIISEFLIDSWTHTNISNSWTTQNQTLTGPEADSITDYSDLRLRFIPSVTTSDVVPTKVADRASANSNSAVTTVDLVLTGLTIGNYLIIRSAADNSGGGGSARSFTLSNQSGTPIDTATDQTFQQNNDPGAASAGVTCNVGIAKITATSGTVRITYGGSVVQACEAEEWSGIHATTPVVGTPVGANGTASTDMASVTDASVAVGNVAYGVMAIEGPSTDVFLQDDDTTDGTWSDLTKVGTTNITADTNQTTYGGYKVVTATGTQTYNPTIVATARDSAGLILELAAADPTIRTQVSWANFELPESTFVAIAHLAGAQVGVRLPNTGVVTYGTAES